MLLFARFPCSDRISYVAPARIRVIRVIRGLPCPIHAPPITAQAKKEMAKRRIPTLVLFFLCQVLVFEGICGRVSTRWAVVFSRASNKRFAHTNVWGSVEEFVFVRPFERGCAVARLDYSNLLPETSCRETSVELAL